MREAAEKESERFENILSQRTISLKNIRQARINSQAPRKYRMQLALILKIAKQVLLLIR